MWKPEQPYGSRCGTRGEASETLQRSGKPWDFAQGPALAILGLGRPAPLPGFEPGLGPPLLALSEALDHPPPPSWRSQASDEIPPLNPGLEPGLGPRPRLPCWNVRFRAGSKEYDILGAAPGSLGAIGSLETLHGHRAYDRIL